MARAAKPYLDQIRATAGSKVQRAIDRIWRCILEATR